MESTAIDTWGLDFGLLRKGGVLMELPVSCRDEKIAGMTEEVFQIMPAALWLRALWRPPQTQPAAWIWSVFGK